MKMKSLKFRLTALYFISFVIATIIIFASFYLTTKQTLYGQTDSLISIHSAKIKEIIMRNASSMHTVADEKIFSQQFGEMPGMIVAIANGDGEIVGGSALASRSSDVFTRFFTESLSGERVRFENSKIGSAPMRFMITPIYQDSVFLGTLIVGHPIEVIDNSLRSLIWELIAVFSLLAIVSIFGGYLTAKQVLSPLAEISKKMRSISHKSLSDRVENPGTRDEMQELATTFNDLLDRLGSAFRRERQFIGDVTHELKTPLSIVQNRIEVALSKKRSIENYERDFREILKDVNNLDSVTKDILDLAWSESDIAAVEVERIDLSALICELTETAETLASQKKIKVKNKIDPNVVVFGKKDKLRRAIINLIDNAIKYTNSGGEIYINLKSNGDKAVLKLKDSGIGIRKHDLPRIFDRFYRGTTEQKIQGNGLGLAIVQSIIQAHHGSIKAQSRLGYGTEITINLPLSG